MSIYPLKRIKKVGDTKDVELFNLKIDLENLKDRLEAKLKTETIWLNGFGTVYCKNYNEYNEFKRQIRYKELLVAFTKDELETVNHKLKALEVLYGRSR